MDQKKNEQIQKFGGAWTVIKIDILKQYLDAYTTALKSQPFNLVLILTLNAQHLSEYLTSDIRIFCRRPPRACVA
jgi:hypothetical protein